LICASEHMDFFTFFYISIKAEEQSQITTL
jgi:hypothetical protein